MVLLLVAKMCISKFGQKKDEVRRKENEKNIYLHNIEYLYIELEVFFSFSKWLRGLQLNEHKKNAPIDFLER